MMSPSMPRSIVRLTATARTGAPSCDGGGRAEEQITSSSHESVSDAEEGAAEEGVVNVDDLEESGD